MTRDVLRGILSAAAVQPIGKRSGHPLYRLKDVYRALLGQQSAATMNPHARLALARAEKVEDEIRVRRGELIESNHVEREFARLMMLVVQSFNTAVDVMERDIGLSTPQAVRLERHFDACRNRLHKEVVDDKKESQAAAQRDDGAGRKKSSGTSSSRRRKRLKR